MKFRLLHCLWVYHLGSGARVSNNRSLHWEKYTRTCFSKVLGELQLPQSQLQADFKSTNSQWAMVFCKTLFYISKWTTLENLMQQEILWGSMGDDLVMGARECWCGHQQTLRLAQQPTASGWAVHAASPTPGTSPPTCREHVVMGNHLLGALCQGCHGCLCDFPSYQPLPISEEMDKLASMVKSQERSVCAQGFAVPDNWITGARNQWTRDYSLLSLWSTTSADLLSILLQTSSPRGNEAV